MIADFRRAPWALAMLLVLAGCAGVSAPRAVQDVNTLVAARGVATPADAGAMAGADPLAAPMTRERAWAVALAHSPRLQAEFARLGVARADRIEGASLSNPTLSLTRLTPNDGGLHQWTRGLVLPFAEALLLPARQRMAAADFQRATFEIAGAILDLRSDVDSAWFEWLGAEQVAQVRATAQQGADAAAELAQRFRDAGNISELQLRQEQAAASEARIAAAQARTEAIAARFRLNTLLGLSGAQTAWTSDESLPVPPAQAFDADALVATAREQRLDLLAARRQVTVLEDAARSGRRWRLLGGIEVGYERETDSDGLRLQGPSLALELPIFQQGQARVLRGDAQRDLGRLSLAQRELEADNHVRTAVEQVRAAADIAREYREALVPAREAIVARSQEQQNYMLIGVFELLQAKAREIDAYQAYLESVRDYWLARVGLEHAVGTALPAPPAAPDEPPTTSPSPEPMPDMPGMDHSQHDMSSMPGMDHSQHDMSSMPGMDHAQQPASGGQP